MSEEVYCDILGGRAKLTFAGEVEFGLFRKFVNGLRGGYRDRIVSIFDDKIGNHVYIIRDYNLLVIINAYMKNRTDNGNNGGIDDHIDMVLVRIDILYVTDLSVSQDRVPSILKMIGEFVRYLNLAGVNLY